MIQYMYIYIRTYAEHRTYSSKSDANGWVMSDYLPSGKRVLYMTWHKSHNISPMQPGSRPSISVAEP